MHSPETEQHEQPIKDDKKRAFMDACAKGDTTRVSSMLKAGINVDCEDEDGRRPLHLACEAGLREVVHLLLKHGADARSPGRWCGTPWDAAALGTVLDPEILLMLLLAALNPLPRERVDEDDGYWTDEPECRTNYTPALLAVIKAWQQEKGPVELLLATAQQARQ